jgi:hypothetical protein
MSWAHCAAARSRAARAFRVSMAATPVAAPVAACKALRCLRAVAAVLRDTWLVTSSSCKHAGIHIEVRHQPACESSDALFSKHRRSFTSSHTRACPSVYLDKDAERDELVHNIRNVIIAANVSRTSARCVPWMHARRCCVACARHVRLAAHALQAF